MEEVKVLEVKQTGADVFFVRINYLGREYSDTISVSGLELAIASIPAEKQTLRGILEAFRQAVTQAPAPDQAAEALAQTPKPRKGKKQA